MRVKMEGKQREVKETERRVEASTADGIGERNNLGQSP
jgi:hypothetical protein